jgi:hypothetical protein
LEKVEKGVKEMNDSMNKNVRIWLILATLIVVAILAALWAVSTSLFQRIPWRPWEHPMLPPNEIPGDFQFFYMAETVVSTVNTTLAIFLLLIYISIYRKTESEFTLGLIIFSTVLLLHAIVSIPLVHHVFGYGGIGLGPFALLPDLFTLGALAVLLYLSIKY